MPTLKEFLKSPELHEFKILAAFGAGCVLGLALFSRILSWTFKKYHDVTLALLCGFMIGSLVKIWPWRNPVQLINKENSEIIELTDANQSLLLNDNYKVVKELAVLPSDYMHDTYVLLIALIAILGAAIVVFLSKISTAKS
jgi:putative membrane protein